MVFDLKNFDYYREGNRLEVKKAKGGLPNSLWDTYSSMANCYGGVILLGVVEREDGSFSTTGLQNIEKLKKDFWNGINDRKKVSLNLLTDDDIKTYEIHGDVVLAIHIPRARREDRPVYINDDLFGGTFRRNGEGDYHCTASEVRAMLRDQTEATADMKVLDDMEISDLNMETVHAYRSRHMAVKPDHVWSKLTDEAYLEQIGAVRRSRVDKKLHPTGAGLLMFGEEYKILYEYPEYFLDYREVLDPTIRWTDRLQSSSGDWTGNPGYIRTGKEQMLRGGISDPRNKALMKLFNIIGIGERAGSGVPDIFAVWESQGWALPEVQEQYGPDRTTLTLPFVTACCEPINEPINEPITAPLEQRILEQLDANAALSQPALAKKLGVSLSTIKRTMKALTKAGYVHHEGSKKAGRWIVLKR